MCKKILFLAVAGITCAAASEYERWDLPRRNKTIQREEAGEIKTVWPDLRLSGIYTRPAMAMPRGGGAVDIFYRTQHDARNNLEQNDEGKHQFAGVTLSQNLYWNWLWFDSTFQGTRNDFDKKDNISDWNTVVVVSPWNTRYQSVAIEGGVDLAVVDGSDIDTNHQRAWQLPTFVLGGRYSGAWGFAVLQANLRLKLQPTGITENKLQRVDEGSNVIPSEAWNHRFMGAEAPIGISYRFFKFLRAGTEAKPFYWEWHAREDDAKMKDWGVPISGYVEVSPLSCMALRGAIGLDVADSVARKVSRLGDYSYTVSTIVHW